MSSPTLRRGSYWLELLVGLAALALLFLVTLPLTPWVQGVVAYALLAVLWALRFAPGRMLGATLAGYLAAAFLCARYFYWRTTETLGFHDPLSAAISLLLYGAELYSMCIFLLGLFTSVHPLRRESPPLAGEPEAWPTVDVLIPTYNESVELLETTVLAATQLRYPADRYTVWVLDDGGTAQRRSHPNPEIALGAALRAEALQALCERAGARYLTRERNEGAKAGNLNAALASVSGELILVLDADHIPTDDFLERTVGFMQRDPGLFLVQTPHFFVNPDPFEKNNGLFGRMPSENEMFYQVIQPGLDFWNGTFFCGSAALLRRSCLDAAGGLAGETITEDAETALKLHGLGYRSVYLNRAMISGLQPDSYADFIIQRVRWAQGMAQIFLLKNPWTQKGLRWYQRLCYTSSSFYWFFGFARMAFLLAPTAYLVFGLKIYDANLAEFLSYAVPYVAGSLLISDRLYGAVRWPFISEVYEVLQAFYTLPGIVRVMLNPKSPRFAVTPKDHQAKEDYVSELAAPFFLMYALSWLTLAAGAARYALLPAERGVTGMTLLWQVVNVFLLAAAQGVLYERRQLRSTPRMPADLEATVDFEDGVQGEARLRNLSQGGAYLELAPLETAALQKGAQVELTVGTADGPRSIFAELTSARRLPDGLVGAGVRFRPRHLADKRLIVALVHGDAERWAEFQAERTRRPGILRSFLFLLRLGYLANREGLRRLARRLVRRPALLEQPT